MRLLLMVMLTGLGLLGAAHLASAESTQPGAPVRVLALGDSLTAGYGLPTQAAYPAVLEEMLQRDGLKVRIHNAGISGDTTAGARARLSRYLQDPPQACILALGANDALRGQDPDQAEANLAAMLEELQRRGVRVLLVGWGATADWGRDYGRRFDAIYPRLAQRFGLDLYPSILAGVIDNPKLTMDGLHPTALGVRIMVQGLYPQARRLVESCLPPAAPAANR